MAIAKKGKLAKDCVTRKLLRKNLKANGLNIRGTVPIRDPGGKNSSHARAQLKGMNFSHVFDDPFSASSSVALLSQI